ncbi:MAG: hypothetical protein ACLTRP_01050 [Clostridioides difficile]
MLQGVIESLKYMSLMIVFPLDFKTDKRLRKALKNEIKDSSAIIITTYKYNHGC